MVYFNKEPKLDVKIKKTDLSFQKNCIFESINDAHKENITLNDNIQMSVRMSDVLFFPKVVLHLL